MSIVGGLVGSEARKLDAERGNLFGEWAVRHAWRLVLLGSIAIWAMLGAALYFG